VHDDSWGNLTLCSTRVNREKFNSTPWEWHQKSGNQYGAWEDIVGRVKAFRGPAKREKMRRFQLRDEALEKWIIDFTAAQLNDTRYASRMAREYLGLLYGGFTDEDGSLKVQVARGGITSELRRRWGANKVLRDLGISDKRHDHRNHALDAVIVALTSPAIFQMMAEASKQAVDDKKSPDRFSLRAPWGQYRDFLNELSTAIQGIKVSHRLSRKVSGRLHEDTLYSRPGRAPTARNTSMYASAWTASPRRTWMGSWTRRCGKPSRPSSRKSAATTRRS